MRIDVEKPIPRKPELLTAAIIAEMAVCEERGDAQCAGLRVRCSASGRKVFFYRYRARDGALREIRLGDVGPLTLAKARDAFTDQLRKLNWSEVACRRQIIFA